MVVELCQGDSEQHSEEMSKISEAILEHGDHSKVTGDFDVWIWHYESFPYHAWELRKIKLFHPKEMYTFFKSHQNAMQYGHGSKKEFFNYCKMKVYSASTMKGRALAEEIDMAEAIVRFFAGTYYSLVLSLILVGPIAILQIAQFYKKHGFAVLDGKEDLPSLLLSLTFIFVFLLCKRLIKLKFRHLRLKEADTVFEAFYLVSTDD